MITYNSIREVLILIKHSCTILYDKDKKVFL